MQAGGSQAAAIATNSQLREIASSVEAPQSQACSSTSLLAVTRFGKCRCRGAFPETENSPACEAKNSQFQSNQYWSVWMIPCISLILIFCAI